MNKDSRPEIEWFTNLLLKSYFCSLKKTDGFILVDSIEPSWLLTETWENILTLNPSRNKNE